MAILLPVRKNELMVRRKRKSPSIARRFHDNPRSFLLLALSVVILQASVVILSGTMSSYWDAENILGPMELLMLSNQWMLGGSDASSSAATGEDDDVVALENHLVDQVEQKLDRLERGEPTSAHAPPSRPLDDYYHRLHIQSSPNPLKKSILIVGGSDGSGTRAFVDTLGRLQVPMLVDDAGTLDVHGQALFHGQGWPPLVQLVLNETHTANYNVSQLSARVRALVKIELDAFQAHYSVRAEKLIQAARAWNKSTAEHVHYGFKAPVSILLLPLLTHQFESVKFLHVVRDGRDVALSSNQSPVTKYYQSYHPNSSDTSNTTTMIDKKTQRMRAMELWNDWNLQALEWARQHNDGQTFDYLVMRTEDLLDPERKFASLLQLADFVGSPKTPTDICCLSRRAVVDMGASNANNGKKAPPRMAARHFQHFLRGHGDPAVVPHSPSDAAAVPAALERLLAQHQAHIQEHAHLRHLRFQHVASRLQQAGPAAATVKEGTKFRRQPMPPQLHRKLSTLVELDQVAHGPLLSDGIDSMLEVPSRVEKRRNYFLKKVTQIQDPQRRKRALEYLKHAQQQQQQPSSSGNTTTRFRPAVTTQKIQQRYGKWVTALEQDPDLSQLLHRIGGPALQEFGYEPWGLYQDRMNFGFRCDASIECPEEI
jgi:hypothetical protein